MMPEKLLELRELKLSIEEFISINSEVWDIGIYGSAVRGKAVLRDIDFIILLKKEADIKKKLELSQEFKSRIAKIINMEIDVKCIDTRDMMDADFLARGGIIAETFLMNNEKNLAEIFGFEPFYIFTYSLEGLNKSKKQMFLYALNGRGKDRGLLQSKKIDHLGKGVIKAPVEYADEIKEFLERNKIRYKIKKVLEYS